MADNLEKQATQQTEFIPFTGGSFTFDCHRGVPCFNECCAKLRLVLTPYDILRIKTRLDMPSGRFLEEYTETVAPEHNRFPMIQLRMTKEKGGVCPFVTPNGCAIYEDRPVACRIYPIGRASRHLAVEQSRSENFFIVKEPHCLGFQEERSWDLDTWMQDQGVDEYDVMNRPWLEIVTSGKPLSNRIQLQSQLQVFFTVSYDVDKFRRLVFETGFFDRFPVEAPAKERIKKDDVELMKFGCSWLKFSLLGEAPPEIKIASTSR